MRVLIVSATDADGGANKAAYRLHRALLEIDVGSAMLVQKKLTDDPMVSGPSGLSGRAAGWLRVRLDRLPLVMYPDRSKLWFSPAWLPGRRIIDKINASDADIVHLHWIAGGMMRIEHIAEIRKPVVWTLHDMWPFTGGCHYDLDCGRFTQSCGLCPQLGSQSESDLSFSIFERKLSAIRSLSDLHLVASSRWMAQNLSRSPMMAGRPITVLPNPVDCDLFSPQDQRRSRGKLGLPVDGRIILFGAVSATNPLKGFDLLRSALDHLEVEADMSLVAFGDSSDLLHRVSLPLISVGPVEKEGRLRDLYSAADVLIVPSIQDNLPLVATESLACGTPVVAFDTTGLPDIVDHRQTGYLAQPFEPTDLANGIAWVLREVNRVSLRRAARKSAVSSYGFRTIAGKYLKLYRALSHE